MTITSSTSRIALVNFAVGGGDGKTWSSLLFHTLFELLQMPVLPLDADQGNRAFSVLVPSAQAIDIMEDHKQLTAKVLQRIASGESILVDMGANALADSVEFNNFLLDLGFELGDRGYSVHGLWIVSTNKVGAAMGLERITRRYTAAYPAVSVFNNRDGSGNMPADYSPDIVIGDLSPGFVAMVYDAGGFVPIINKVDPEFQLSCNYIASYVWKFADQEGVRQIFGNKSIDSLKPLLNREVPRLDPYVIYEPLTDNAFLHQAARAKGYRLASPMLDNIDAMEAAFAEFNRGSA